MEQHIYCIGGTRVGKTEWMLSTLENIEGGFCFLDKHGDAAKRIADAVPCIYWRAADLSHPIGFNVLQNVAPDARWKTTADIVSIFSDIWKLGPETPRLLYYLRAALRLLLDTPGTTLLDIRRVLSDASYRSRLLRAARDMETLQTWSEFDSKDARQQAQEIGSLQNKVAALADPLPIRFILSQPTSTISVHSLLRTGTPLVVDLSDIGDEPAAILGAFIINAFKQAADETKNTNPYRLYVDEFQNFGTSIISTILSESGKRELWLTLAHQFISQLDEEIRDAVLGNCSTKIAFRVGAEDAPIIAKALDWSAQDLQDQKRGQARMVTLHAGKPTPAVLLHTRKAELTTGFLERNTRHTRARYARPRDVVERMLQKPQAPKKARREAPGWGRRNGVVETE